MLMLFFLYLTKMSAVLVMLKAVVLVFSENLFNTIESFDLKLVI